MSRHPNRARHPVVAIRRRQVLPAWVRRIDAAAARRITARRTHPAVDLGYARLSHAANRSVLWFSIAAVLFVLGRRRAAVRGSLSLLVASVLANLVGKRVFGGDRPLLKDIPIGRRLKKHPTSASFPSGHSASAAGFATGVALEAPRIGLAVTPVAAAVAYSRLHTGAHWLSDVVGGSALGAAIAGVGKVLLPVRATRKPQTRKPQTREGGTEIDLPALAGGEGAFIVVNPSSGATIRRDPMSVLADRLPRARLHELGDGEDVAVVVRTALASSNPPRVLGVYGGDGTVGAVAQLAREAGLPLLVLPGGTFNHFARTAGVETIDDAIDALLAGEGLRADVAELTVADDDPITVLNTASAGIYPDFVAEREKLEPSVGKWIGALIAAVRVLRSADPVHVTVNGRSAPVWSLYIGVNRNYPSTVAPLQRRRLDDGVLDVRILHAGARPGAALSLAFGRRTSAMLRRLLPRTSAIERFVARAVTVIVHPARDQAPGLAHDGEVRPVPTDDAAQRAGEQSAGKSFRLQIKPNALEVYSPFILRSR